MATEAIRDLPALPDDGLAEVLRVLPPQSLAVARCVCRSWRDIIDDRALLHPHLLPRTVRGVFFNYIDHDRPHLLARPASSSTFPKIDGLLRFLPNDPKDDWWTVLDHCSGLVICKLDWGLDLVVCNPATWRWTLLPGKGMAAWSCAYIAFDPTMSPQYHVFLIPDVPEKPKPRQKPKPSATLALDAPFCIDWFFALPDGALSIDHEDDQTDKGQDASSMDGAAQTVKGQCHDDDDPCRLMEWPPSIWSLKVFSSSTSVWEDRLFVREGPPVGTVEDMRRDPREPTWQGPRQRYAVYQDGELYVHCRGSFVSRFSLSTNKYRVIKVPTEAKHLRPYLGGSMNAVYFGIVTCEQHGISTDEQRQLRVWKLSESCGHMEWLLKYDVDVGPYADYVYSIPYYNNDGTKTDGSWIVQEARNCNKDGTQSEESQEWDSDKEDIFTAEVEDESRYGWFDVLGFHPYKEVVFLGTRFGVTSYHLRSQKIQYLGNSRPNCYYHNHTNGRYESFIYTPCLIGDLRQGRDDTGYTSFKD